MARYVEVISLVTSDEELVELVEVRDRTPEVISLVTSEEETSTEYNSDEEYWRQRKKACPFVLWECSEQVGVVDKSFFLVFYH